MGERKRHEFPEGVKKDVKRAQGHRCGYCSGFCRGHGYGEPRLEIHHVLPDSAGGPNTSENAVGLCGRHPEGDCGCHASFDNLYFSTGKTFVDVMVAEGRNADLRRLRLDPRQRRQDRLRTPKAPPALPHILHRETGDYVTSQNTGYYEDRVIFRGVLGEED